MVTKRLTRARIFILLVSPWLRGFQTGDSPEVIALGHVKQDGDRRGERFFVSFH